MRFSWYYLENMSVYRIDPRKMAVALDDSKRVNGKLNQLKDHLKEFFHLIEIEDTTIWEYDRNEFLKSIEKVLATYLIIVPFKGTLVKI